MGFRRWINRARRVEMETEGSVIGLSLPPPRIDPIRCTSVLRVAGTSHLARPIANTIGCES
jgi:hypothetical protein